MRVGVAQVAPVFLRRDPTLGKVTDFIADAAGAGCRLVVFGESLVPGYPVWLGFTDGARFDSDYPRTMLCTGLTVGSPGSTPTLCRIGNSFSPNA